MQTLDVVKRDDELTGEVKLTDFGAASPPIPVSKEDERSAALAARAQKGDYDDGRCPHFRTFWICSDRI